MNSSFQSHYSYVAWNPLQTHNNKQQKPRGLQRRCVSIKFRWNQVSSSYLHPVHLRSLITLEAVAGTVLELVCDLLSMGWALTRERNKITNERDDQDGKPAARQLAPMIFQHIREQWQLYELEYMAMKGDRLLKKPPSLITSGAYGRRVVELIKYPLEWLKQPSLGRDDRRYHVDVRVSHREQKWEVEAPSASLFEGDPELILDVDIAAKVSKDVFLDEKIPKHESSQGYMRVVEQ